MAIITRWRMPPDSSCGYCRSRRSGSEMRTASSASQRQPPRRPAPSTRRWARIASAICRPTRHHRVERGHRLLEDHRDLAAAHPPHLRAPASAEQVAARRSSTWPPAIRGHRLRQQPHDRQRGHRLAASPIRRRCTASRRRSRSKLRSSTTGLRPRRRRDLDVQAVGRASSGRRSAGSFEDDAREVERDHPVRLVDDLADPEVAADRARACRRRPAAMPWRAAQQVDHLGDGVARAPPSGRGRCRSSPRSPWRRGGASPARRGEARHPEVGALHQVERQRRPSSGSRWRCRRPRRRPGRHGCRRPRTARPPPRPAGRASPRPPGRGCRDCRRPAAAARPNAGRARPAPRRWCPAKGFSGTLRQGREQGRRRRPCRSARDAAPGR